MTQAVQAPLPLYLGLDGQRLQAGYLFFGVAELNPETNPVQMFWDAALTQPASQPIRTINGMPDRNGTPAMLYTNTDHSLTIRDSAGRLVLYARNSLEYTLEAQMRNAASAAYGAGMIGYDKALAYVAGTVGATLNDLGKRKAVFATGVPATDVANIQAAIDEFGPWTVASLYRLRRIDLFGSFVLNDEIIYQPCMEFVGFDCQITQLDPNKHAFKLIDELIAAGDGTTRNFPVGDVDIANAFPGRVTFRCIYFNGPLSATQNWLPANNEPLGQLTLNNVKAAIFAAWNGRNLDIEDCWFFNWHTGVFAAHMGPVNLTRCHGYNNKYGCLLYGEANGGRIDAWFEYGFIGIATNYDFLMGGIIGQPPGTQPFTKSIHIEGVYQYSMVGLWLAGLYDFTCGKLYFEGNQFHDAMFGDGTNIGQVRQFEVEAITSGGGPGAFSGWTGGPTFTGYVDPGTYFAAGNARQSCPIAFLNAAAGKIESLNCAYTQGLGTRWAVYQDANCDAIEVGTPSSGTLSSSNPYKVEDQGRLTVNKTGKPRWGLTKSGSFFSYPLAWGDPMSTRWGAHDDPANPSSQATGVVNWLSYEERTGTANKGLVLGGRDASGAFLEDGGEVKVQAATFMIRNSDGDEDFVTFKTGFNKWDFQYAQVVFEPACTGVEFRNVATLFDRGTAGQTYVQFRNLPTTDPGVAGRLWVDTTSIPGRKLLCIS